MKGLKYLAVLMVVGLVVTSAQAATYVLSQSDIVKAITIDEEQGTSTPLPATDVRPGPDSGSHATYAGGSTAYYVVYDLSGIGAGETVTNAEWSYTGYYGSDLTVSVSSATSDWEGLTGYTTVANYWNNDWDSEVTYDWTGGEANASSTIDVTDIVAAWVSGSATNYGLRTNGPFFIYLNHSSFADPTLTIETSVPEPTSMALLGVGGLAMLYRRRRRR